MTAERTIAFDNVSKFYGEVLGVNRVHLALGPGITSLVGPNGSGKSTLMNLMTGLLHPTEGRVRVLGIPTDRPEELFRRVGYATQYDSFPAGMSGREFLRSYLRVHGFPVAECAEMAERALEQVGLTEAGSRNVAGYSKGMRQRIRLAHAIAHNPSVVVLDEPLNGLDPVARAEMIDLFQAMAGQESYVVISSHILHEVDIISDQVVLLNEGYIVAEGDIKSVRSEMSKHPLQILIRCKDPSSLAAKVFEQDSVVEVKIHDDRAGLLVSTRDADGFFLQLNHIAMNGDLGIETVAPADDDVQAVYQYLIGGDKGES